MHALGLEFGSAVQLSKRPGSVWNCLWGNALKISPGIIRKSRVSYPGPGFLSSATWPSLPKKHYNGLKPNLPRNMFGQPNSHAHIISTSRDCCKPRTFEEMKFVSYKLLLPTLTGFLFTDNKELNPTGQLFSNDISCCFPIK